MPNEKEDEEQVDVDENNENRCNAKFKMQFGRLIRRLTFLEHQVSQLESYENEQARKILSLEEISRKQDKGSAKISKHRQSFT